MFVVSQPGDEIAVSFDAAAAPPLRAGWRRTFLLHADGFSKEMNIRSATPDTLGPLPFHAMTTYPYGAGEHYPERSGLPCVPRRYNTRVVSRTLPITRCRGEPSHARRKDRSMTLRYSAAACQTDFVNPLDRASDVGEHGADARDDRRRRGRSRTFPARAPRRVSRVRSCGAGLSDRSRVGDKIAVPIPNEHTERSSARRASTTSTSRAVR